MWFTRLPMSTPCGSGSKVVEVPTLSELQILDHDRRTSSGCRGDVGLKTPSSFSAIYQLVKPGLVLIFPFYSGGCFGVGYLVRGCSAVKSTILGAF